MIDVLYTKFHTFSPKWIRQVEWDGVKVQNEGFRAPSGGWERKEIQVIGTGGLVKLLFRESMLKSSNTGSGAFLDHVVLKPAPHRRRLRAA